METNRKLDIGSAKFSPNRFPEGRFANKPDMEFNAASNVSTSPVRTPYVPAFPVASVFSGGWQAKAKRADKEQTSVCLRGPRKGCYFHHAKLSSRPVGASLGCIKGPNLWLRRKERS